MDNEKIPHLFSKDNLLEYAKQLAYIHEVGPEELNLFSYLIRSLRRDSIEIKNTYKLFSQVLITDKNLLPSSSEWLLDNYFVINEQILSVKNGLTGGFYKDLAKLNSGSLKNYPRIYGLAWELLLHTDQSLELDQLKQFVLDYEAISPLTSAEIWALPIMLRLILLSKLAVLTQQAGNTYKTRKSAQQVADRLIGYDGNIQKQAIKVFGRYFYGKKKPDTTFLVWLLRGLRDQDSRVTPAIRWLEKYVLQEDINIEEAIKAENHKQATKRITAGNIVTSLRLISTISWKDFFESTSMVEKILRQDSAGLYGQMDFESRDRYRHVVEDLSRYSKYNEQEVARRVLRMAEESMDEKSKHVGYWLVANGIFAIRKNLKYKAPLLFRLKANISYHPTFWYLTFMGGFLSTGVAGVNYLLGGWNAWILPPLSVAAIGILNSAVMKFFSPTPIPKLELDRGIPIEGKTLVVIPCLLSSKEEIEKLASHIEEIFFANREDNLYFGLLTDFVDAPVSEMEIDKVLIQQMEDLVNSLNHKHDKDNRGLFYLFHRSRIYNEREKIWMGWERKRGKLEMLNRLLVEGDSHGFSTILGNPESVKGVNYVITLDTDTKIPFNAAKKLIGSIIHPLNKAVVDIQKRKVVSGYGIIQPRVDVHAPAAIKTEFSRLHASEGGLDPYHSLVSNVYQDMFENSVYIGKAIYDVRAFHACLDRRFPDNQLLSHDLLEGLFLRVAFAPDIIFLEDFPKSYISYSTRQQRWIRGDWQIFNWLFFRSLDYQDKWKIFDNLRRSLIAPCALIGLLVFSSGSGRMLILILINFSLVQILFRDLLSHSFKVGFWEMLEEFAYSIKVFLVRFSLAIAFLPYEAWRNSQAIFLAGYRSLFKVPGILEWTTQSASENKYGKSLSELFNMGKSAIILGAALLVSKADFINLSIVFLSTLSPFLAYWISKEIPDQIRALSDKQKLWFRKIAIRTWKFFDELANAENNYLPVDNIQTNPGPSVAKRTSPTNIGFLLTSIVSAYDLGILDRSGMILKLKRVFETLDKMEKYQGHFFNWYRTDTLQILYPNYVSTADSGNLAACLLVVEKACREIASQIEQKSERDKNASVYLEILRDDWVKINNKKAVKFLEAELKNDHHFDYAFINDTLKTFEKESEKIIKLQKAESIKYWREKLIIENEKSDQYENGNEILLNISERARQYVEAMNFEFLYSPERRVFSVGYNVSEKIHDASYYNLLASESRLAGLLAIALKQVSEKHWFELGRPMKKINGKTVLYSWGGTMFEYLMPNLFTRDFRNTIIYQTNAEIVKRQISYARHKKIPWGISESGYYALDFDYNYQYRQFGVPDLSIKREVSENLVVSPYSSFLALEYAPLEAYLNLQRLSQLQVLGEYGFFEAIDFNTDRLPEKVRFGIVSSYMAHHQGMIMAAINNCLNDKIWQRRFHANDLVTGVELLLGEKIPRFASRVDLPAENIPALDRDSQLKKAPSVKLSGKTENLRAAILSNSEYTTVISNSGTGYSMWKNLDVTRFRTDTTDNNWGWFNIIQNKQSGQIWSATYQPFWKKPDHYHAYFYPHKAEFVRIDGKIETKTVHSIAVEENVEFKELIITNKGGSSSQYEITDFREVVLLSHRDDVVHAAFGKLFMESEFDKERQAILWKRRDRAGTNNEKWYWHSIKFEEGKKQFLEFETDRERFLGRGNDIFNAQGLFKGLTNFSGVSLDPIVSFRTKVSVKPQESKKIIYLSGVASSRNEALETIDKYKDVNEIVKAYQLAEIHSQIEQRHFGISADQAGMFQKLGSKIVFPERNSGADLVKVKNNTRGLSGLFAFGISGDFPIVLLKVESLESVKIVREVLLAHEYLRMKNIRFDVLILNQDKSVYSSEVKQEIVNIVDTSLSRPFFDKPGGVYLRDSLTMSNEDIGLWESVARVTIDGSLGSLENAFDVLFTKNYGHKTYEIGSKLLKEQKDLEQNSGHRFNLWGKFSSSGNEYVLDFRKNIHTPLPWSNVLANPEFGSLVTGSSLGYSWYGNSQQNKLTSWSNDPVTEKAGEYLYVKDPANNSWRSLTSLPDITRGNYRTRHGFGYSVFECTTADFAAETTVWVDKADPIKLVWVKLTNNLGVAKKLRLIYFAELVMGVDRENNQFMTRTYFDGKTKSLCARNYYNEAFADKIFFAGSTEELRSFSADRTEFVGVGGSINYPYYLNRDSSDFLSKRTGTDLDPATIVEVEVFLRPGEEKDLYFYLGQTEERKLHDLLEKYINPENCQYSLAISTESWKNRLAKIKISTPNKNLDILINGWLPYQALAGRFWARTGFYQSGGAIGFRDQLQDCLAFLHSDPALVRKHLLTCAEHQFIQGDVMHWWHPETNQGVRTRVSDDLLWLPFITYLYIEHTQDWGILDELVGFMDMEPLAEGQNDRFDRAIPTREKASLYEHCIRALDRGMKKGVHGLPLMGSGDWNDGLNKVGHLGRGESVWLGWFQMVVYNNFVSICREQEDKLNASSFARYVKELSNAINNYGWDGSWYRRAFADNGDILGGSANSEGSIDLISQVWSALIENPDRERVVEALKNVEKRLIDTDHSLVKLMAPPYNANSDSPGYIQGYVPGIRENGAQYTHAAVWLPLAYLNMDMPDKAMNILEMINPINLTKTIDGAIRYKGEPYVLAGDVYSNPQHVGRVGWTWYTGSAAWMYWIVVESVFGIKVSGDNIRFDPKVPDSWKKFQVEYRYQNSIYKISYLKTGASQLFLDGKSVKSRSIRLSNRKRQRKVLVTY